MKVKGQVNELKKQATPSIEDLKKVAAAIAPLDEIRAANLLKLIGKLQEWQNR